MKKLFCLYCIVCLLAVISGCGKYDVLIETTTTVTTTTTSPPILWRGWPCAFRDNRLDIYTRKEVDGSDVVTSSEGSLVTGYYERKELRIIKITVYQSRHQVILRFYPFDDAVVMISETIRYATDKPLYEITEDDMYLESVLQAVIKDDQVYHYINEREPMCLSDDTWYAEIYTKAVEALAT